MWPEESLRNLAKSYAEKLAEQIPALEAAFAKLKDELTRARAAANRAENYVPIIGGKVQCPQCCVMDTVEAEMVQTEVKDKEREEHYRCPRCRTEYPLRW